MSRSRSRKAIIMAVVAIIILLSVLGFAGWRMLSGTDSTVEQQSVSKPSETSAEVILTQDDLEEAEKSLDELDFDDADALEAQKQANL